jgi:hypothetical protein
MAANKTKKVIALDGDKLGMIGGMVGAFIVLIICLVFHVSTITSLIRIGWGFVICYGATFFLVSVILRTTLIETIDKKNGKNCTKKCF